MVDEEVPWLFSEKSLNEGTVDVISSGVDMFDLKLYS